MEANTPSCECESGTPKTAQSRENRFRAARQISIDKKIAREIQDQWKYEQVFEAKKETFTKSNNIKSETPGIQALQNVLRLLSDPSLFFMTDNMFKILTFFLAKSSLRFHFLDDSNRDHLESNVGLH